MGADEYVLRDILSLIGITENQIGQPKYRILVMTHEHSPGITITCQCTADMCSFSRIATFCTIH